MMVRAALPVEDHDAEERRHLFIDYCCCVRTLKQIEK